MPWWIVAAYFRSGCRSASLIATIMDAILVRLVHRQDAIRREAVDRRHHRRRDQIGEGVRREIGLVVDQVELAGALEDAARDARFPHLGVDRRIFLIAARHHAGERAARDRILRGEQGHVDAARDQRLGEQAGHQLPRPIGRGGVRHAIGASIAIFMPRISPRPAQQDKAGSVAAGCPAWRAAPTALGPFGDREALRRGARD
jgi:hypothetical protein